MPNIRTFTINGDRDFLIEEGDTIYFRDGYRSEIIKGIVKEEISQDMFSRFTREPGEEREKVYVVEAEIISGNQTHSYGRMVVGHSSIMSVVRETIRDNMETIYRNYAARLAQRTRIQNSLNEDLPRVYMNNQKKEKKTLKKRIAERNKIKRKINKEVK